MFSFTSQMTASVIVEPSLRSTVTLKLLVPAPRKEPVIPAHLKVCPPDERVPDEAQLLKAVVMLEPFNVIFAPVALSPGASTMSVMSNACVVTYLPEGGEMERVLTITGVARNISLDRPTNPLHTTWPLLLIWE